MKEIVKHINNTNASYRKPGAGDAKNTDLFLDNEHYDLFKDSGNQIKVRYNKENLSQAVLFIASLLPRKYDNSSIHKLITFSPSFVYEQLELIDGFFIEEGKPVTCKVQTWNVRKDVPKENGEIDKRFYFNGLIKDFSYRNNKGVIVSATFTIRNYLAGEYSDLHFSKSDDGIFDVWITNALKPYSDSEEFEYKLKLSSNLLFQQIVYGAPGTGKSHDIKKQTEGESVIRTTFHPDSDYSTFVGAYKPIMGSGKVYGSQGVLKEGDKEVEEPIIKYQFVKQAFLKAYLGAWKKYADAVENAPKKQYLIIEEINRGNCAQIFGDIFQLLDRNDEGFSSYPIEADEDLQREISIAFAEEREYKLNTDICVDEAVDNYMSNYDETLSKDIQCGRVLLLPPNLYIWATMNTSDQSLFPMDSAFKRRWEWEYMPIEKGKNKDGEELDWKIEISDAKTEDWWKFLQKINDVIYDLTKSEDKQLGFFFCKPDKEDGCTISAEKFVNKVIFYLWNDVFKDYDYDADCCKVKDNKVETKVIKFSDFHKNRKDSLEAFFKTLMKQSEDNQDDTNASDHKE